MFGDLHADLKRIEVGKAKIPWAFDPDIDPLQLRLIQFDYIRLGDFADAKKVYREISHQGKDRNFFASKDIWEQFRDSHSAEMDPIPMEDRTSVVEGKSAAVRLDLGCHRLHQKKTQRRH